MTAYYNENDPFAASWLRELIKAGHIAPGDVDERDIRDVTPDELSGYAQCHFFAGIGVWSYALRRAGWPDGRPVWTGSCPCQPFSAAGKGAGFDDERHLWPSWFWLIGECRPPDIFGEQVSSADGDIWLDLVCPDLEGAAYAVGALDICAAGVGAPHKRQRLYFHAGLAHATSGETERVGEPNRAGRGARRPGCPSSRHGDSAEPAGDTSGLGLTTGAGSQGWQNRRGDVPGPRGATAQRAGCQPSGPVVAGGVGPGPTNGFWRDADWLLCRDGSWRPAQPGSFPLVTGAPARVGRLRGYGNALCAEVAATFIAAYLDLDEAAECLT